MSEAEQPAPAPVYCIDTCCLIDGWRVYDPEMFSSLWERLAGLVEEGRLVSSDEVLDELSRKADAIYEWAKVREGMFLPLTPDVVAETKALLARYPRLLNERKGRNSADPYVIALAKLKGCVVVSEETPSTNVATNPKVPSVCLAEGIECIRLADLIKRERWKF